VFLGCRTVPNGVDHNRRYQNGGPADCQPAEDFCRSDAGRILGDMPRCANAIGIATPLSRAAYCHLQVHENPPKANRLSEYCFRHR
jgi:hypothetical protein